MFSRVARKEINLRVKVGFNTFFYFLASKALKLNAYQFMLQYKHLLTI